MSRDEEIKQFVRQKVYQLEVQKDSGMGKATMAELRRGVGKKPGELPMIWGAFLADMPETFLSKTDRPSREEWACYIAVTLFALHQQGQEKPMQVQDVSFGNALRKLAVQLDDDNAQSRVLRRMNTLAQAKDIEAIAYYLRNIVTLLRGEQIALDYGRLAGDIYDLQFSEYASAVYLRWGRDFYRIKSSKEHQKAGEEA